MTDALLIIDMQQGSFGPASPRHDAAGLVQRLNRLASDVRSTGGAVVFIQHDGPPGDPHHPDLPGWRLLPDLDARPIDTVIRKQSCDAFLRTTLGTAFRFLRPLRCRRRSEQPWVPKWQTPELTTNRRRSTGL